MNKAAFLARDAVVYGDSAAGFAAAVQLHESGRNVLLVSRHTGLLREASWGLLRSAARGSGSVWQRFRSFLESRGAWRNGYVDGACTEVLAAAFARRMGLEIHMFSPVCAVDIRDAQVHQVRFLRKGCPVSVQADIWIDASSRGELMALCGFEADEPSCDGWWHSIVFRHPELSPAPETMSLPALVPGIEEMEFGRTTWPNESIVRYREATGAPLARLSEVLADARARLPLGEAIVSHASVVPLAVKNVEQSARFVLPNLVRPQLAADDLGDLFDAGEFSVSQDIPSDTLEGTPKARRDNRLTRENFDVAIAGLGTGGAIASIAASRGGARVGAFDSMPLVGGVGTVGGIHLYYFGVQGGLQAEVDERIRDLMPLFAPRRQVAGFHPFAKMCVLQRMLAEANVMAVGEASIGEIDVAESSVRSCSLLAAEGLRSWTAEAWVDATGDGDLAVAGGADWLPSPRSDGVGSAFSQASGWIADRGGQPYLRIVNFDAGYVDALDADDLTRARLRGLSHYESEHFSPTHHPTLIAPLLGIRQSRQIVADAMIELADLAGRSTFEDCIGYAACHLDSHAIDFEFEPLDIAFWIWGCRNWRTRTACEIPFGSLRVKNLKNVLLGSRSFGVSPVAHQAVRMQRDIQRVGECAGWAAAFVARFGVPSSEIPLEWLRENLRSTGALGLSGPQGTDFGKQIDEGELSMEEQNLDALLEQTRQGFGTHMYLLAQAGRAAIPGLRQLLAEPDASWRAAVILSYLGDPAAEPRLVNAVREREVGFAPDDSRHPDRCQRLVPNWLAALVFLRNCGGRECLLAAENLLASGGALHNVKTSCGLLALAILERKQPDLDIQRLASRILRRLVTEPDDNSIGAPQRNALGISGLEGDSTIWYPNVTEDFRWQLDLVRARLSIALGEDAVEQMNRLSGDSRAYVRKCVYSLGAGPFPPDSLNKTTAWVGSQ